MTRYPVFDTYLTEREMETLRLVVAGRSNKEMAALMRVSIKTVEKFRQELNKKLCTNCTVAAIRVAIKTGLVQGSEFLASTIGENISHGETVVSRHNAVSTSPPAWFVS